MRTRIVVVVALAILPRAVHAQTGSLPTFRSEAELARFVREQADHPAPAPPMPPATPQPSECAASTPAAAAATVVRGQITDDQGRAIPGALVRITGMQICAVAVADSGGRYRLVIPREQMDSARTLTIMPSRVGMMGMPRELAAAPGDSLSADLRMTVQALSIESIVTTAAAPSSEPTPASITNTQHAGVDEGGIVKLHGDHLVMLRRGRLFTVAVGGDRLATGSLIDVFDGGIEDPDQAWYDEMLISGDRIIVIGFNYERGGTEIGLFHIDRDGRLSRQGTYHFRSGDYYSSRNYASRLIGSKLVLYMPVWISDDPAEFASSFPAMRRWRRGATDAEFRRVIAARQIHRPALPFGRYDDPILHTVLTCELGDRDMECHSMAVLGPQGRVFYVSPTAVYVWLTSYRDRRADESAVYRIPLNGGGVSALRVAGSPIDQFSFLESEDRHLNVLVSTDGRSGDGMWNAERPGGELALLRVPLASFGDGRKAASRASYRPLPGEQRGIVRNRFVGNHLLYGWGSNQTPAPMYAVRWRGGSATEITLPHGVERIEAMGGDAVVIGEAGRDLHFTAIRLDRRPAAAQHYERRDAAQGEERSHGFFYQADGADAGTIGLPIVGGDERYEKGSAAVIFLRNANARFHPLGELAASVGNPPDDGCVVSCVDWYGNARPLFLNGRVFALLGYEIVEGTMVGSAIRERRRISYAPRR